MMKKAGIIVAAAAAGLVALTPFAFADNDHHHESGETTYSNVQDGNVGNECEFGQAGPAIAQDLTGGDSLVGAAGLVTGAVAPVTTQTQAANCTNVNLDDLVDLDSNNETRTATRTEVEDSYNTDVDG
ncbi:hypothetical protein [Pseudonocardia lacus]|uniref:hypothetical protein n=1 Tax=Pseudonocardia lacus TaxID=2835865 RepID=UPI001BDCA7CA|nr:hypothetical protein [Pseudonocardia lacus]